MNTVRPALGEPGARRNRRGQATWGSANRPFGFGQSLLVVAVAAFGMLALGLYVLHQSHTPVKELPWTVARTAGLVAYGLLWLLTVLGLVRSHPRLQKVGAHLLPWHQWLGLFTLAFVVVHAAAIVVDPYAGVGLLGALWPGLSSYRTIPVAMGTTGLWALALVGLTARFGQRWLGGIWRSIHRGAMAAFVLGFFHAVLVGSDTPWLATWYAVSGGFVWCLALSRYWVAAAEPERPGPAPGPGAAAPRV
jgi:sulfoxide reductase heme-binding subunit YedZ